MKVIGFAILLFSATTKQAFAAPSHFTDSAHVSCVRISQQLLLAAKTHEATDALVAVLGSFSPKELFDQLKNDNQKKAFWLNVYNAFTQLRLQQNPGIYENKNAFFGARKIVVAGQLLSLDDIEHGILRHSKIKWSLGHLNKWFPSAFEKAHRVDTLDYRIHFALNCGARSCPPIAFYDPLQLNRQLDLAMRSYLTSEVLYDTGENKIGLPAIMGWFRRDFGGKRGMRKLLQKLEIVQPGEQPTIYFRKYNWELFLQNYKS